MADPKTVIAVNRFGLGARPGELARADDDPRRWLLAQVQAPPPQGPETQRLVSSAEALLATQAFFRLQQRTKPAGGQKRGAMAGDSEFVQMRTRLKDMYADQAYARLSVAARSAEPFAERLSHFWTNHFAVSADKPQTRTVAATLEYEAIRPHIAGTFAELLLAVEQHPAMIVYLDNGQSIGPGSPAAKWLNKRGEREWGLNENLAREILELHTLGVNGGYTQDDVRALAHVITGWTVAGERMPVPESMRGHFVFREERHEPGAQRVLGKRYRAGGIEQGEAVLRDLAVHPSTARHIATKLVRHFVADTPPPAAVDRVAGAFERSGGDLPAVYAALLDAPEAWAPTPSKLKTPHDFVVSTFRALDHVPDRERAVKSMELLGQPLYLPGSPAGWPDTAQHWGSSGALLQRIEWADAVSERVATTRSDPLAIARAALGPLLSRHTATAISRAASAAQGLTLLLVSPDFQRR